MNEPIEVDFTVECDDFRVPAMPELNFGATYHAYGFVTPGWNGDWENPPEPHEVNVSLLDPQTYTIQLDGTDLPEWLQYYLATEYACEIDEAFLQAIGGQSKLDELAVEKALCL